MLVTRPRVSELNRVWQLRVSGPTPFSPSSPSSPFSPFSPFALPSSSHRAATIYTGRIALQYSVGHSYQGTSGKVAQKYSGRVTEDKLPPAVLCGGISCTSAFRYATPLSTATPPLLAPLRHARDKKKEEYLMECRCRSCLTKGNESLYGNRFVITEKRIKEKNSFVER